MNYYRAVAIALFAAGSFSFMDEASAWRSTLYDEDWTPPESQDSPPSFETDKLIQDFSYAGYRRSETRLPEVTGPILNVVEDFGADPSGELDATVAIQDAIDAAAESGGGVVFLPEGTFRVRPRGSVRASLLVRESGVVLRGAGPSKTFLLNDAWEMRGKDIIRLEPSASSSWASIPAGSPLTSIRSDLLGPTQRIPVDSVEGFTPGDWIVLRADASEPFKEEHNMGDLWGGQSLGAGVLFVREVLFIDETTNVITIDVPIRYYLKTRDDARVHLLGPHVEEVGLEHFSIGNVEHPEHAASTGWGLEDYNVEGTHAYDVHGSYAIRLARALNCWVRNVHTYRPAQNSRDAHVLSNAFGAVSSVAVTVVDSHFQRALYAGGGGNAYMLRITSSQEILVQDTTVGYNRHGFVFSSMQASGNVIHRGRAEHTRWRAIGGNVGSSGSDHHMWLSQSNLVDGTQLFRDYFAAYYRHTWGSNHGQTAVHSVFWNLEGLEYYSGVDHIVNTQQARYGYAIGTRGPAPAISTSGVASFAAEAHRTDPPDHVEGEGMGDALEPRSLFDDQLRRRLTSEGPEGRASTPSIFPHGGTYYEPRRVRITSETPGAEIRYTLNGSVPAENFDLYEEQIELIEDTSLCALAHAPGLADSQVACAKFSFPDAACQLVTDAWQSTPTSLQSGVFELHFEATPQDDVMNSVMGLSYGEARRYQDLAVIARFSPEDVIDARNGGGYEAVSSVAYEPFKAYLFRFVVDLPAGTYDLYVRAEGDESEIAIGREFELRSEQSAAFRLDSFSSFAAVGENVVCDIFVPSDAPIDDPDDPDQNGEDEEPMPDPDQNGDSEEPGLDTGGDGDGEPSLPDESDLYPSDERITTGQCGCASTDGSMPLGLLIGLLALGPFLRRRHGAMEAKMPSGRKTRAAQAASLCSAPGSHQ